MTGRLLCAVIVAVATWQLRESIADLLEMQVPKLLQILCRHAITDVDYLQAHCPLMVRRRILVEKIRERLWSNLQCS